MPDKTTLNKRDRDFDRWDVAVRGDVINHNLVVSADTNTGVLVLKMVNGDGFPVNKKGEVDENTREHVEHYRDNLEIVPRRVADEAVPEEAAVVDGGLVVEAPAIEEHHTGRHHRADPDQQH